MTSEHDRGRLPKGRLLAIDHGERRIGLAVSDPLGMIASPAGFVERRAGKRLPIAELVRRAEAGFGHPVDVEFCFDGRALWLLQCRAITT